MAGAKRKRTSTAHQADPVSDTDLEHNDHDEHSEGAEHQPDETPFTEGGVTSDSVLPAAECPFTVIFRTSKKPKGKKAKKHKAHAGSPAGPPPSQSLDQELPEDQTVFSVKPKKQWDSLKKYRNFVVGTENFALNEYIFVNHESGVNAPPNQPPKSDNYDRDFWVARVLEIRAADEAHVYLRVYWLYWPEELPGGRQPYHGEKELIASNHMEIIDAMTVSGRAHVKHWLELDEDEELPDLFWRQKYDFPSKTLMEVREHCKCHRYYNPDKLMYGCPHCKTWLHEECVKEDIKRKALTKVLAEEGEESVRAALAAIKVKDETGSVPPAENDDTPAPATKKQRGRKGKTVSSSSLNINGKTATPSTKSAAAALSKEAVHHPTSEQLDQMFDVQITISNDDKVPAKAVIRDLRPRPRLEGEEYNSEDEYEYVSDDAAPTTKTNSRSAAADKDGQDANVIAGDKSSGKKEKVRRRKARAVWEEEVMCLLCQKAIY